MTVDNPYHTSAHRSYLVFWIVCVLLEDVYNQCLSPTDRCNSPSTQRHSQLNTLAVSKCNSPSIAHRPTIKANVPSKWIKLNPWNSQLQANPLPSTKPWIFSPRSPMNPRANSTIAKRWSSRWPWTSMGLRAEWIRKSIWKIWLEARNRVNFVWIVLRWLFFSKWKWK